MTSHNLQSRSVSAHSEKSLLKYVSLNRSCHDPSMDRLSCNYKPQEKSLEQFEDPHDFTEGSPKIEASVGSIGSHQSSQLRGSDPCNLYQFLESTTPIVQAQYLAKSCQWDSCPRRRPVADVEIKPYFTLGDLWDSFDEWSAFGAGVPIILNGEETVVQYYVPYLSAVQLYVSSIRNPFMNFRRLSDDSDVTSDSDFRDTSSEASSDNETLCHCEHFCGKRPGAPIETSASREKSVFYDISAECQLSDCGSPKEQIVHLLFEHFEHAPPHARVPLADKISQLSKEFKELRTLRSIDLLPTSWVSVAWYPIYRIPLGTTLKDLGACFLSYHNLSTPLGDNGVPIIRTNVKRGLSACSNSSEVIALEAFGLASYKLRGPTWTSAGNSDKTYAASLMKCADAWLKQLNVRQPDYEFFCRNSGHLRDFTEFSERILSTSLIEHVDALLEQYHVWQPNFESFAMTMDLCDYRNWHSKELTGKVLKLEVSIQLEYYSQTTSNILFGKRI
eukprot:Gb_15000 [translate_table: standard]